VQCLKAGRHKLLIGYAALLAKKFAPTDYKFAPTQAENAKHHFRMTDYSQAVCAVL